jgi:hypothetical protein
MLQRTGAAVEAVAALLYNLIYDQDGGEGWTPDDPGCDPSYRVVFLCFAEAVMQVLEIDPNASDAMVMQKAAKLVDRSKAGFSWEFIAMDEKVVSLLIEAEPYVWAVREFLENPDGSPEGEFLRREAIEGEQ